MFAQQSLQPKLSRRRYAGVPYAQPLHGTNPYTHNATTCIIFTAQSSYASADLGIIILSVRPSIARVLCEET